MKLAKTIGLLAVLGVFLIFPLMFTDTAITSVAVFTLIYAVMAVAWNIFSGYTGYISLGQAVFFGFGAYTFGMLSKHVPLGDYNNFLYLIPAGLVAALFAIPLGWVALRTRRHIFVVITIAILFIFQLFASNLSTISNGQGGITTPVPNWPNSFFYIPFYYVALTMLLLVFGVAWWVRNSKFGLGLLAIRDDEERAQGLGVQTGYYKLAAYMLSALFMGMAGGIYFYVLSSLIKPAGAFDPSLDITIALMAFLGGVGTIAGPLIGAVLLVPIGQYMDIQINIPGLDLVFYGGLLLIVIIFLPEGLVPSLRKLWLKYRLSRKMGTQQHAKKAPLVESIRGEKG